DLNEISNVTANETGNCFTLTHWVRKSLILRAKSKEEMMHWANLIREAISMRQQLQQGDENENEKEEKCIGNEQDEQKKGRNLKQKRQNKNIMIVRRRKIKIQNQLEKEESKKKLQFPKKFNRTKKPT